MSERDERESLPEKCDCGGRMLYERAHGRIFSACEDCTPVVEVRVPRLRAPVDPPEREVEDVLRDAAYEIAEVERPASGVGCTECGRDVETVGGSCIRCAAKSAPTYWDGPPERVSEQEIFQAGFRRGNAESRPVYVERVSEASALRDFAQEIADEGCAYSYPDGCPNGGTRKTGECESCRARRALEDTKGDT